MAVVALIGQLGVTQTSAAEKLNVSILRYPQFHMFLYVLGDSQVVLWDADTFQVTARCAIPAPLRENLPDEDYFLDMLNVVPTETKGLLAMTLGKKHMVVDAEKDSVVSSGNFPGSVYWCYPEEGRTLCIAEGKQQDGHNLLIAYDAISRDERHKTPAPRRSATDTTPWLD